MPTRYRLHRHLSSVTALLLLVACSQEKPSEGQLSEQLEQGKITKAGESMLLGPKIQGHCFDDVALTSFPWAVSLNVTTAMGNIRCTGVLISPDHVLTAAHCVDRYIADTVLNHNEAVAPEDIALRVGSDRYDGGQRVSVSAVWRHPDWRSRPRQLGVDAALLRLARPFTDSPVLAIRSGAIDSRLGAGWIVGWGRREQGLASPMGLGAGKASILANAECARLTDAPRQYLDAGQVCTLSEKTGPCAGDSGGALIVGSAREPQLVALSSRIERDYCGLGTGGRIFGMYTPATSLLTWLQRDFPGVATFTAEPPGALLEPAVVNRNPDPHCKGNEI